MEVTFITDAEFVIESEDTQICLDFCFYDSTQENPIMYSKEGHNKTIYFQLPKTKCVLIRPGHTFGIKDASLATEVDTYIN